MGDEVGASGRKLSSSARDVYVLLVRQFKEGDKEIFGRAYAHAEKAHKTASSSSLRRYWNDHMKAAQAAAEDWGMSQDVQHPFFESGGGGSPYKEGFQYTPAKMGDRQLADELRTARSYVVSSIPAGADKTNDYWRSRAKTFEVEARQRGLSMDALKSGQTFSYFAIGAFFVVLTGAMLVGIGRNRSAQGGGGLYAAPALADGTPVATGAIPYGRGLYPWQRPAYERFGAFG